MTNDLTITEVVNAIDLPAIESIWEPCVEISATKPNFKMKCANHAYLIA